MDLNRGNLVKRTGSFAKGDIEIVLANFAMHSDGKIPDVQVEKIEKSGYATVRRMTSVRCVRCQRGRRGAPTSMLDGASMTLAESALGQRAPEEESLWSSATRLRSAAGDLEEKS